MKKANATGVRQHEHGSSHVQAQPFSRLKLKGHLGFAGICKQCWEKAICGASISFRDEKKKAPPKKDEAVKRPE